MTTALIEHPADTRRMWNRIAGTAGIASVVLILGLAVGISASAPVFTDGADVSLFGVMTLEPVRASDDVLVALSALDSVTFFVLLPWATAMYVIFA